MTVQELLSQASHLSLKEQLQLAAQLLRLVDRQLDNPAEAINPAVASSAASNPTASDIDNQEGSIGYLLTHPISVHSFKPLSRDEIYDRR
ncbi:hypothetical protein ACQ4N7_17200 [Nodosilinea sp. AN01ver1]|uniref:hypothetical protein n=1 Tax=Nodosilinea sp. AN01ver1 TaxID=3423362 RepID=UPI003D310EAF